MARASKQIARMSNLHAYAGFAGFQTRHGKAHNEIRYEGQQTTTQPRRCRYVDKEVISSV